MEISKKEIIKKFKLTQKDIDYLVNTNSIDLNNIIHKDICMLTNISNLKTLAQQKSKLKNRPNLFKLFTYKQPITEQLLFEKINECLNIYKSEILFVSNTKENGRIKLRDYDNIVIYKKNNALDYINVSVYYHLMNGDIKWKTFTVYKPRKDNLIEFNNDKIYFYLNNCPEKSVYLDYAYFYMYYYITVLCKQEAFLSTINGEPCASVNIKYIRESIFRK